jgi:hypothetical protein
VTAPLPPPWRREFTIAELDRFITKSKDLRRRGLRVLRDPDLGVLVLAVEQAALAWAIATRIDLERTQTGTHLRAGDTAVFERPRRLSRGPVEGESLPSVMAEIALAVNDGALAAAAGEGRRPGDHARSLYFAELWCRQVEEALEPTMKVMEATPEVFSDTKAGRSARAAATDPLLNRAYLAWVKRVVKLRRRDLILDPKKVKARSFYARLGPTEANNSNAGPDGRVGRVLSTTAREMIRDAENKRRLIQMFDASTPGGIFALNPRRT